MYMYVHTRLRFWTCTYVLYEHMYCMNMVAHRGKSYMYIVETIVRFILQLDIHTGIYILPTDTVLSIYPFLLGVDSLTTSI
jgi:hypothetical protein